MVQQLLSGSLPGLTVSARIQPCRMHTKANRSSGSINTNICDNIQISSQKALFFNHFFFFHIIYMYLFSTLGTRGVLLSRVNCWDWPGICTKENVTQFPAIKIYKKGERSVMYDGMWGTEELTSFIML